MKMENAVYGRCGRPSCQHVWPVVYLPMPLTAAAQVMARATCPKCGDTKNIKIANEAEIEAA